MSGEDITVELIKREQVGKGLGGLRAQGLVPAVVHNHGGASTMASVPFKDIEKTYELAGKHHPLKLNIDGKKQLALIKDVGKAQNAPRGFSINPTERESRGGSASGFQRSGNTGRKSRPVSIAAVG